MTTRSEREKAQKLNEQHQAILSKMLREDDNKYCADCEAKGEMTGLEINSLMNLRDVLNYVSVVLMWCLYVAVPMAYGYERKPITLAVKT